MMLATQLKLLKEKRGLTNQQLADLSGVPVGTVNRILSGQTDNPSFQTICDLVLAMDGSLDELAGIEKAPEGPESVRVPSKSKKIALGMGHASWSGALFSSAPSGCSGAAGCGGSSVLTATHRLIFVPWLWNFSS